MIFFQRRGMGVLTIVVLALAMSPLRAMAKDNAKPDASTTNTADTPSKPVLIVHDLTVAAGVPWPYDVHQIKANIIASLQLTDGDIFNVVPTAPSGAGHGYVLEGEITSWHPGNQAVRSFVGYGAGRESAIVHYWVIDPNGEKVFEHTDTIRASFYSGISSVGELAHPLADKIAGRIQHAKLIK